MAEKDNCSSPASIRSSISDPESEFESESSSEEEDEMTGQKQQYMFEPRRAVRDSDAQNSEEEMEADQENNERLKNLNW